MPGFEVYYSADSGSRGEDVPRAEDLLRRLPRIEREVAQYFEDAQLPPLDLEITPWAGNHAGKYSGGKLRVDLSPTAEATIAHELAHAHAFHAAGRADIPESLDATRFFHEGLAEWIEAQVVPEHAGISRNYALSAALFRAREHHVSELLDGGQRMRTRAIEELYALGHAFVQALVHVGGIEVLPCLVRAERDSTFTRAAGPLLWADLARRCRIDLEAVSRAYAAILETWSDRVPDVRADLRVSVVRRADAPQLEVLDLHNQGLDLTCRFRPLEDTPDALMIGARAQSGTCDIPRTFLAGDAFWYQVGHAIPVTALVAEDDDTHAVQYGPWIRAQVPDAPRCAHLDCVRDHSVPWSEPNPWSLAELAAEPHIDGLADGAVTHDDRYVVLGFRDGVVEIRDGVDGRPAARWSEPHATLETIELSPDETRLLARYEDQIGRAHV